jgi:putative redox protein
MEKVTIHADWHEGLMFETELNGHKLIMDAAESGGGTNKGPRPKPLMLAALAGCTGMDVISILQKMKVGVKKFRIWVEADQTEEHPKHYAAIKVIYEFTGTNLPMDKLEKAISLSEERYCGVGAVYRKAMKVTHEVRVNEE